MRESDRRTLLILMGVFVIAPLGGSAQGLVEVRERGSFGVAAVLGRPVGEFQQFVGWGGGLNLFGVWGIAPRSGLGIRFDGTFIVYGSETQAVPFSRTAPRVLLDMSTTNSIVSLGIGPQLTVGRGPVTAYVYGLAGFSYFSTISSLRDVQFAESIASTTNFDDATFALTGGGGLRLRVSRGHRPVSLDFGVSAVQNGEAEYLRRGSIRERADGSVFHAAIRSDANLLAFKLGVIASVF